MYRFRVGIIIVLIAVSAYSGWFAYGFAYDILQLQLKVASFTIDAGEQLGSIKDTVGTVFDQALSLLGDQEGTQVADDTDSRSKADILASYENKLQTIAGIVGLIFGYLVWKFLSSLVLGLKKTILNVGEFLGTKK